MSVLALVWHKTKNEPHKLKEASWVHGQPVSLLTSCAATNKSKSSALAKQSSSSAQAKQSTVIPSYTDKAIVKDPEICWAIKVVMSHFSHRPGLDINKFPDSSVANDFSFSKTKCA